MPCPKCNGKLKWIERSYSTQGEDPGHWSCVMCGKVIYPDKAGSQKPAQNIPEIIPSTDCDGEGDQKMTDKLIKGKECSSKNCAHQGEIQPLENFNKNHTTPDGLEYHCRDCKQKETQARRDRIKKGISAGGNGRKKRRSRDSGPVRPPIETGPVAESLYMDPAAIRSIKRSVGKEILSEFSKFLETRYA